MQKYKSAHWLNSFFIKNFVLFLHSGFSCYEYYILFIFLNSFIFISKGTHGSKALYNKIVIIPNEYRYYYVLPRAPSLFNLVNLEMNTNDDIGI